MSLRIKVFAYIMGLLFGSFAMGETTQLSDSTTMTTQFGGFGPFPFPIPHPYSKGSKYSDFNLQFGYNLNNDYLLKIEFREFSLKPSGDNGGHQFNANTYGIFIRKFISNSFHINSGLNYMYFNYQYNNIANSPNPYTSKLRGQALNYEFSIGNQWYWKVNWWHDFYKFLTISWDWVGVSVPLNTTFLSESVASDYNTDSLDEDKKMFKSVGYNLFRVYFGVVF